MMKVSEYVHSYLRAMKVVGAFPGWTWNCTCMVALDDDECNLTFVWDRFCRGLEDPLRGVVSGFTKELGKMKNHFKQGLSRHAINCAMIGFSVIISAPTQNVCGVDIVLKVAAKSAAGKGTRVLSWRMIAMPPGCVFEVAAWIHPNLCSGGWWGFYFYAANASE